MPNFKINEVDAKRLELKVNGVPISDVNRDTVHKLHNAVEVAQDYLKDKYAGKVEQVGRLIQQRAKLKGEDLLVAGIGMANEDDPFASPVVILAATMELLSK